MPRATVKDMDLNRLRLFRDVVLAGSFSRAAARLRMPKSRVSRHIAELETEIGAPLIYRTTRQFRLTQTGTELFQKTSPLLGELGSVLEQVSGGSEEVAGPIKITVPEDIGSELFGRLCHGFLTLYPKVELQVHASNQLVDLVKDSIDIALRIGAARDSSMIRRKVGSVGLILAASPAYLERAGVPARLEHLEGRAFLAFAPPGQSRPHLRLTNGRETRTVRVQPGFSANNFFVLRSLALAGAGVAPLPAFLARETFAAGTLVPVLREWTLDPNPVQLLIPAQKEVPLRIRALLDYLSQHLAPLL